jgi:TatA/E family protein of Tat protein translocase
MMSSCLPLSFFAGTPGPMELIVIFMLVLVLFGPRRLPEIAKTIGKVLHELRRASEDFKDQVMSIETDGNALDSEPTEGPEDPSFSADAYSADAEDPSSSPDAGDGEDFQDMTPIDLPEDENSEAHHDRLD